MIGLTERQADLLRFIQGYQEANGGRTPQHFEMRAAMGLLSNSGICRLLDALEERARIKRDPRSPFAPRAVEVISPISIPRSPEGAPLYSVRGMG